MSLDIRGFLERNWLTLLLFILALFNSEIRRFLTVVKTGGGNVFRWYRYNTAKNKLEAIQQLHGNTYNLLLYLTVEAMIYIAGGVLIGMSLYAKAVFGLLLIGKSGTAIVIAALTNKFFVLFRMIFRLAYYDGSVKSLTRVIEKNAPKTGASNG